MPITIVAGFRTNLDCVCDTKQLLAGIFDLVLETAIDFQLKLIRSEITILIVVKVLDLFQDGVTR